MKDINILNVMSDRVFSCKTKDDLKLIMNIDVENKDVSEILKEVKEKWSNLDPIEKQAISQSLTGKYYSSKFQTIMES